MDKTEIWTAIVSLAIGSFFLRYVFVGFIGDRELPPWVLRHLRYTAVAMLPGLAAPLVIWPVATGGETEPARLTAALVTFAVGYWRKNVLLAIIAGALTLYLGLYLLG